jgi:hypothetical protein
MDVGQMAALGQNPAMLLMQQGPQIAQIYAGNGGVNAAFKDLGTILGGIVTKLGPLAALAGAAAAGFFLPPAGHSGCDRSGRLVRRHLQG